ncbi:MAG: YceI family protein [Candidatus Krumholzibacteria bacterium]|nr:YceI family protein [Candidatus Krumholzibacteria bacterium]
MRKLALAALAVMFMSSTALATDTFMIDGNHSSIGFSVKHMVISKVKGTFGEFEGMIMYDEANMKNSSVSVTIKTASISTANDDRDGHIKGDEFLDAAKHPEIKFHSTKVMPKGDGFVAVGDLTIRGVTKSVQLPFNFNGVITDPWGNTRMGADATLKINRHDFGVSWSEKLDNGGLVVGNEVFIDIQLEAVKKKG